MTRAAAPARENDGCILPRFGVKITVSEQFFM
jgi:hypothetical protein